MGDPGKFGLQVGQVGPACACAANVEILFHIAVGHVARLRHEPVDHTVKADVVIGTGAGQVLHPRHMAGGHVGQKLDDDVTTLEGHDDGVLGVFDLGHWGLLA